MSSLLLLIFCLLSLSRCVRIPFSNVSHKLCNTFHPERRLNPYKKCLAENYGAFASSGGTLPLVAAEKGWFLRDSMNVLANKYDYRKMFFKSYFKDLRDSCNIDEFSNAVNKLLNTMSTIYLDCLTDPVAFLLLFNEIEDMFSRILRLLEENITDVLRFSSMCIIDVSPSGRIRRILLVLQCQELLYSLSNIMAKFNHPHDLGNLDDSIRFVYSSFNKNLSHWSFIHYKAIRSGLIVLAKIALCTAINNVLIPIIVKIVTDQLSNLSKFWLLAIMNNINLRLGI